MFVTLLLVTFVVALIVSFVVVRLFEKPIDAVLGRIIAEDISVAWERYLKFAIYIVGVSGGVRVWQLERYIMPGEEDVEPLVLNGARWTLEVYRTIIGTLQSVAWMLLVFFLVAMIAYVVVRGRELKHGSGEGS